MSRHTRLVFLAFLGCLAPLAHLPAQMREDANIANVLAVQNALYEGRQHLLRGEAKQAIAVLEAKLPYINGNRDYLAVLRDAYWAQIKDLQRNRQDDQVPAVMERLRLLDPAAKLDGVAALSPAVPLPGSEAKPDAKLRARSDDGDPFQQAPLVERASVRDLVRRGEAAFKQNKYAEAGKLFAQAHAKDPDSLGISRGNWAYCRLHEAVARLNQTQAGDVAALNAIESEVQQALSMAKEQPQLAKFGQNVLERIQTARGGVTQAAAAQQIDGEGWTMAESANFRVLHKLPAGEGERFAAQAEKLRTAIFEKWFGTPTSTWNPRCDIYLHASAAEFNQATKGYPQSHGFSTVDLRDGKVTRRRLDLVGDNVGLLPAALPRELTHIVLADLFPDPLLPRWADEAMAILAEPRANVDRYLKVLPRVRKEGKLFPVGSLITSVEFPDTTAITAFYVQSVSLTEMLVSLRGAKAFAIYLQDARRYGYEKALERNYSIRNFNDLQTRWHRHAFGD